MAVKAVDPPTIDLAADNLVDWLEITALLGEFHVARIDEVVSALLQLEETPEDDIAQHDRHRDELVEKIENEIYLRSNQLKDAYPFILSESGEEVSLVDNWTEIDFSFYLVCLIASHVTKSPILRSPPSGGVLYRLRNRIFQMIATLALAGLSRGPAISVGWPRNSGEVITQLLARASSLGAGFDVRQPPGPYVSPKEKDGGVDVIAWNAETLPPPSLFFFAQTASGLDWTEKPVISHASVFKEAYMQDFQCGNKNYVTVMPYRILDTRLYQSQHLHHCALLDRLALPLRAKQGLMLYRSGVNVDDAEHAVDISRWLSDYIHYIHAS